MKCRTCNKKLQKSSVHFIDVLKRVFFIEDIMLCGRRCFDAFNKDCAQQPAPNKTLEEKVQQRQVVFAEQLQAILNILEFSPYKIIQANYQYAIPVTIPTIRTQVSKGPVEEQVALEKATERLNPLQLLKPIKPYWEADFIKKIVQNIAEFFGLRDIYKKGNSFYSLSYSITYGQDEKYNKNHN